MSVGPAVLSINNGPQREIAIAAQEQGWSIERTSGGHIRMIPPDPTKDIIILGKTSGDCRAHLNLIKNCRKSGLIWPPPDKRQLKRIKEGIEEPMAEVAVIEEWKAIDNCCMALVSNGGRIKLAHGGKIVRPDASNTVTLTNDQGEIVSFNASLLTFNTFGHMPHKNVIEAEETEEPQLDSVVEESLFTSIHSAEAVQEVIAALEDNQETPMTVTVEEKKPMPTPLEVAHNTAGPGWTDLKFDGAGAGCRISAKGDVVNAAGRELAPNLSGNQVRVNLRPAKLGANYRSVRVDVLVLNSFVGTAPYEGAIPIHLNGDNLDCHVSNLRWSTEEEVSSKPPIVPPIARGSLLTDEERKERKRARDRERKAEIAKHNRAKKAAAEGVVPEPAVVESVPVEEPLQITPPKGDGAVQSFRMYRFGGLDVLVSGTGETIIMETRELMNKPSLSVSDLHALAKITPMIEDMNRFMGLS